MPTIAEALALALEHHRGGRLDTAEAIYRQILAAAPDCADALHLLGLVAYQRDRHAEALDLIQRAIRLKGTESAFHLHLAEAHRALRRMPEALAAYHRALELDPRNVATLNNLGNALQELGRVDEACACYQRAIQARPDFAKAHYNLGFAYREQGRLDDALACMRRALELQPDYAEAHSNLGNILKDQGRPEEALACYRPAMQCDPSAARYHSNLLYALLFCADVDAETFAEEHRRWTQRHAAPLAGCFRLHPNSRDPHRRLRIGYVSPDLRVHPVGRFVLPLLEARDAGAFEVFCYASVAAPDGITQRCRAAADAWRDTYGMRDAQLAEMVRGDGIDILVDLSAHMAQNRMLLFARKPAPVQVTYLAYCGTTGLPTMDFRLTDPHLDPPGQAAAYYAEQSVWLPETYWCYVPAAQAPPVNDLPALANGHVTFGCLNTFGKVTQATREAWCRLLRAVPGSRLIVHSQLGSHRDAVRAQFAREGVAPERINFVGLLEGPAYFGKYQEFDLGLDPFPYCGGTTTCDALWMGVPVVSLVGATAVGRAGRSILTNVGLPGLVADTRERYVALAAGLAQDLSTLRQLRGTLRARMQQSPLMDGPRFTRHVEAAFREMWRRWCG